MRRVHVHDGGIDGIICDAEDCSYITRVNARRRRARWLVFATCALAAIICTIAIAAEHQYGLIFLALSLLVVPVMCHEVLADRYWSP